MKNGTISFCFVLIALLASCDNPKKNWEKTEALDTIESYETYLQKYPESKYKIQAQDRLEYLNDPIDWQRAVETNSISSYEEYLRKHRIGIYSRDAEKKLNELYLPIDFQKAITSNTIEDYRSFIQKHPDSQECEQALLLLKPMLYQEALSKKELKSYEEFLHFYPNSKEASKIESLRKLLLYEEALSKNELELYEEFLHFYPNSKEASKIESLRKLLIQKRNCDIAENKLSDGDDYSAKIDYDLIKTINIGIRQLVSEGFNYQQIALIFAELSESSPYAENPSEISMNNIKRVIKMADDMRDAHNSYKEAMDLARDNNCSNVYMIAYSKNTDMMNKWILFSFPLSDVLVLLK